MEPGLEFCVRKLRRSSLRARLPLVPTRTSRSAAQRAKCASSLRLKVLHATSFEFLDILQVNAEVGAVRAVLKFSAGADCVFGRLERGLHEEGHSPILSLLPDTLLVIFVNFRGGW